MCICRLTQTQDTSFNTIAARSNLPTFGHTRPRLVVTGEARRGGGGEGDEAHLKKKEAAVDEAGEGDALGAGSPAAWLELLSRQGVRVVVVAVVVLRATAVTALARASEAEPSLSASPIEPC